MLVQLFVNSEYWPAYATEAARSTNTDWDEVGEMFVRECVQSSPSAPADLCRLDMTQVVLKLNAAEKDTLDQVYADTKMDLKEFLERCLVRAPTQWPIADLRRTSRRSSSSRIRWAATSPRSRCRPSTSPSTSPSSRARASTVSRPMRMRD